MQPNTAMKYQYIPIKRTMPQPPLKKPTIPVTGENEDSHSSLGGMQNGVTTLRTGWKGPTKLNHLTTQYSHPGSNYLPNRFV